MNLNLKDAQNLQSIIEKDVKFLAKQNIMDYSLLFGIGKKQNGFLGQISSSINPEYIYSTSGKYIYYFKIIDYLQYYGRKKKAENWIKRMTKIRKDNMISVIPPKAYGERFKDFMSKKLFRFK